MSVKRCSEICRPDFVQDSQFWLEFCCLACSALMLMGLYSTTVVISSFLFFFSSFLVPNLWGHGTDLNQTWTHIHLWMLFGPISTGHLPSVGWWAKTLFFGTDFELWPNISLSSFCPPLNFRIGRHWTLYDRQQANFGTCYVVAWAYSLEQQNAGGLMLEFAMHLVILCYSVLRFTAAYLFLLC